MNKMPAPLPIKEPAELLRRMHPNCPNLSFEAHAVAEEPT